jgi:hypothetical protein
MTITADVIDHSGNSIRAVLRVLRIWGSKQENWNAWIGVFTTDHQPDSQFSVSAEYVEGQNPFEALYAAVSLLSFVKNVEHDVVTELKSTVVPVDEAAVEDKKPTPRSKKKG